MIKKILSIMGVSIVLLFGASQIPYSFGLSCAGPTIEEEFSKSQWVFLGKFISETNAGVFSDNTILHFEVIENYKGNSSPIIKVLNNPSWRHSFSSEESIIFAGVDLFGNPELFLCTNSGETSDQWISKVRELSEFFDTNLILPSPKVQIKNGIEPGNILCREDLVLIFKVTDYSPVCVKPATAEKLIQRGWGSDIINAILSSEISSEIENSTSSYMNKIIPTLDDFKAVLSNSYDIDEVFSKFGQPQKDIGSGIHIYVYELNDSTEIWIGYADNILYLNHVDSHGKLLEQLFMEYKN